MQRVSRAGNYCKQPAIGFDLTFDWPREWRKPNLLRGTELVTGISVFQKFSKIPTLFVFSPKFCIIIVFKFSWDLLLSQEKLKTMEGQQRVLWYFWKGLWLNRRKVLHDDVILLQQFYQNPSVCCFLVQMRAVFQTSVRLTNLSEEAKTKRILVVVVNCRWGARVAPWWEPSPPTNVARVQILATTPNLG